MAQIKRIKNCISSQGKEDDWTIKDIKLSFAKKKIPQSVDLRADWWGIGNQGSTGSCVGWATADSVLRYHFTKANKLKKGNHLSVRFTWMASKEMDEYSDFPSTFIEDSGTSLKAALKISKKFGALTAKHLPFDGDMIQLKEKNFLKVASKYKISKYVTLTKDKDTKLELFKQWLAFQGPILTCLDCDKNWNNPGKKGLLTTYDKKSINGGHCMSIVGYTPTHFIIRNSWGKEWGDKGFAYASYDYAQHAFKEAYGVII